MMLTEGVDCWKCRWVIKPGEDFFDEFGERRELDADTEDTAINEGCYCEDCDRQLKANGGGVT